MKQVVSRAFTANDLVRIQTTFVSCTSCIVTDGGFVVFDRHQVHWFITPSFPALLISLETFSLMKNPRGSHLSWAGGVVGRDVKGQLPPGTGSRQQNNVAQNAGAAALGLCSREAEQPPSAWSHERPPLPFLAAWDWERLPRAYANFPVIWSGPSHTPQDLRACVY